MKNTIVSPTEHILNLRGNTFVRLNMFLISLFISSSSRPTLFTTTDAISSAPCTTVQLRGVLLGCQNTTAGHTVLADDSLIEKLPTVNAMRRGVWPAADVKDEHQRCQRDGGNAWSLGLGWPRNINDKLILMSLPIPDAGQWIATISCTVTLSPHCAVLYQSINQSINQLNNNLPAREPDIKWYAVEIIDKNSIVNKQCAYMYIGAGRDVQSRLGVTMLNTF